MRIIILYNLIKEKMGNGEEKEANQDVDGLVSVNGRILVSRVNEIDSKLLA